MIGRILNAIVPPRDEVALALAGTGQVLLGNRQAMRWFNATVEGFWRSFFAGILVLPIYALLLAMDWESMPHHHGGMVTLVSELLVYVVHWTAWPVLMLAVLPIIDRGERFLGYIVAYNWLSVPLTVIYGAVLLLNNAELLPGGFSTVFAVLLAVLFAETWLARLALSVGWLFAIGLTALDFALSLTISGFFG